jgi:Spy/CpxP family protein refolding chaperone
MMARIHRSLGIFIIPLALAGAACGGSVASEPVTQGAAAATRAPVAVTAHAPQVRMIGDALAEVPLRPDQRTAIEQLATDAETRHTQAQASHKDFMLALAAQVETGTIDKTALQPKIDAMTAAWQANRPADRAAFEQLHALLDSQQRGELVDALEAKAGSHEGGHKGMHAGHERMKEWATALSLTDDQTAQIKTALKAQHEAHAGGGHHDHADHQGGHGKKMLEAFRADTFSMDAVAPAGNAPKAVGNMSEHTLGIVTTVLPILTPAQRTLAAQKIRDRANAVSGAGGPDLF